MSDLTPEKQALLNIGLINGWVDSSEFAQTMRYSLADIIFSCEENDNIEDCLASPELPETRKRFIQAFLKKPELDVALWMYVAQLHRVIFSGKETYEYHPGEWVSDGAKQAVEDLFQMHESTDYVFTSASQIYNQLIKISPFYDGNKRMAELLSNLYLVQRGVLLAPVLVFSRINDPYLSIDEQVAKQTKGLVTLLHRIRSLNDKYLERTNGFAKQRKDLFQGLLPCMMQQPRFTIKELQAIYQKKSTYQTINELFKDLVKLNVLKEETGNARFRVFHLHEYTNLFTKLYE